MGKANVTLYIDNDLKDLARKSGLLLSSEFEEWLRTRLNIQTNNNKVKDYDLEVSKLQLQIKNLQSAQELTKERDDETKVQNDVVDSIIDNMIEFNDDLNDIKDNRINGLQFLFKKKLNIILTPNAGKERLINRIKERAING